MTPYLDTLRWEAVKNTSGETCPAFGLLAVTGSEMRGTTYKRPVLLGAKPSTTFYQEYVANGPTAIPAGGYGRATRGPGAIWIKYDSGTPANGEGWGPKPGQWTASKGFPGIVVEGVQSSSKTRMLGTLAPITKVIGKTDGAIGKGSGGTIKIYVGTGTGLSDSTMTASVTNIFGDVDDDIYVAAEWINNGLYLTASECSV